jgi:thioredoxin 1
VAVSDADIDIMDTRTWEQSLRRWTKRRPLLRPWAPSSAFVPVLVAFWAEGYGSWHLLAPELAALAEAFRGRAAVATLDVEAEPETPKRYGIETLPAVLFFKGGEVVDRLTGVVEGRDGRHTPRPDGDRPGLTTRSHQHSS